MFLYRKNIILVPSDYDGVSNAKGLISLDCYDAKVVGSLKTYNLSIQKPLLLGVAINGKINKINVNGKNVKNMQFVINNTVKNTDEIACVLLNLLGDDYKIVLWGSNQINKGYKASLQAILDDIQINNKPTPIKLNSKDDYICDLQEQTPNAYSKTENEQLDEINNGQLYDNTNNFSYEQAQSETYGKTDNITNNNIKDELNDKTEVYSYDEQKINSFIDKVIDMTEDEKSDNINSINDDLAFYERINPQIEKMFKNNKQETLLNEILPNSKFCRVEFEDGSGYYVFGIIYDDGLPKYLCYGLPAKKDSQPPEELSNLYQWLPIDVTDEDGDGYYMMYQDAITGKNIALEIM